MGNSIDDAFAAADARTQETKHQQEEQARVNSVYDAQVVRLMESAVEAIRLKAEELNAHPRITNKAAIMPAGSQITIRRMSLVGMPERTIRLLFRRDLGRTAWVYESTPNPVFANYETVDQGEHTFDVVGDDLRIDGFASPELFADRVLARFRLDCIEDAARVAPRT
jgi:hypothetical protein